jgi:hypothetical protein
MTIINNYTPMVIDPNALQPVTPPTYAQMEQAKDIAKAQTIANDGSADGGKEAAKGKKKSDFADLMPKWMLAMGEAYTEEQQLNGSNGAVGKYLKMVAAADTLKQAFNSLISSASSYTALKQLLQKDGSELSKEGFGVGAVAQSIVHMAATWSIEKGSSATQIQSEEQSEQGAITQLASTLEIKSEASNASNQKLQSHAREAVSDENTISQFLNQMSSGFVRG